MLLLSCLALVLLAALALGSYRSYCKVMEMKSGEATRFEIPELWRSSRFQSVSSIIVTLLSFVPAYFGSLFIGYAPPEPMFFFWLIVILFARHFISYQVGFWLYWLWKQNRPVL